MRYAATLQTHWDWRAAANFAFGGSGGGLLVASALLASPANLRASIVVLGLGLIGAGLTMVWLEIGRPLRAANVNRRPQTSWMTREAYAAAAVFALGGAWLLLRLPTLWWMTAAAAATFVWCQARILRASKGVPAWREPAVMILIAGTASTEGAALLTLMSLPAPGVTILSACMALLALRWLAWRRYRERLRAADPAAPLIAPLARLDASARRWGLWVPGALLLLSIAGSAWSSVSAALGAAMVVSSGWYVKFMLVTRLSHLQGYGLGTPRRGHPLRAARSVSAGSKALRQREVTADKPHAGRASRQC